MVHGNMVCYSRFPLLMFVLNMRECEFEHTIFVCGLKFCVNLQPANLNYANTLENNFIKPPGF